MRFLPLVLLALTACQPALSDRVDRKEITASNAPAAIGPYSHAQQVGHTLYLSGQVGLDPVTGQLAPGGIEAETRQALMNLKAVLDAADFAITDVVQAQVFLADLNDFTAMNAVYGEFFGGHRPARATVQVARLPRDARIEIMLVAHR